MDHLRLWSEVSLPVLLIVVDVNSQAAYWTPVKRFTADLDVSDDEWRAKSGKIAVPIPCHNAVSPVGLAQVLSYVRGEILYLHAKKVRAIVDWWSARYGEPGAALSASLRDGFDESMLPIRQGDYPEVAFPDLDLENPALAYCWGCGNVWWIEEAEAFHEEYNENDPDDVWMGHPPLYLGTHLEPNLYHVDPEFCPRCLDGNGILKVCIACGAGFLSWEDTMSEHDFKENWGEAVSYRDAQALCAYCVAVPKLSREPNKRE